MLEWPANIYNQVIEHTVQVGQLVQIYSCVSSPNFLTALSILQRVLLCLPPPRLTLPAILPTILVVLNARICRRQAEAASLRRLRFLPHFT